MIYEIKKFQDKKKPHLLVYGHIHHYKRKNADGNHTWVCKNNMKGCRGFALTDSKEEDATLMKSPQLHSCSEYNKKKATATKLNSVEDSESDYSPQTAAQEEQTAPFSIESETHEDGRLSMEAPKDSESNDSLHSAAQEEQVSPFSSQSETDEDGRLSMEAPKNSESNYSLQTAAQEEQVAPFSNEPKTHEGILKTKREDTVKGNDNKINKTKTKSRSRASQNRANMKKCQIGNAEGKGNKLIQKTNTNNLYKFQL